MSLRYSGSAVFRSSAGTWTVQADLRTDVSAGVYSWGGRLSCTDLAALGADKQGGTLALPALDTISEVHVAVADLNSDTGGVTLRVDGHGRAPYEQDGDIVTTRGDDGAIVYARMTE
jgi:hypothetical protein